MLHYRNCGLDYVYLANGFTREKSPYGPIVAVQRARELHRVIAQGIVTGPAPIRGQEVRFLRSLLQISQTDLAKCLGSSRTSVARWEGNPVREIPGTSDRALRMFYTMWAGGDRAVKRLVELLRTLDDLKHAKTRRLTVAWEPAHEVWVARTA
ncbi:MAG: hypothetical protein FJX59_20295 [Alphaproteobacteria bacterium]|nr:hypothetical protein [Alphaproteobacteria bacterium]